MPERANFLKGIIMLTETAARKEAEAAAEWAALTNVDRRSNADRRSKPRRSNRSGPFHLIEVAEPPIGWGTILAFVFLLALAAWAIASPLVGEAPPPSGVVRMDDLVVAAEVKPPVVRRINPITVRLVVRPEGQLYGQQQ